MHCEIFLKLNRRGRVDFGNKRAAYRSNLYESGSAKENLIIILEPQTTSLKNGCLVISSHFSEVMIWSSNWNNHFQFVDVSGTRLE